MKENKGCSKGEEAKQSQSSWTLMPVIPVQISSQRPGSYKNPFEGGLRHLREALSHSFSKSTLAPSQYHKTGPRIWLPVLEWLVREVPWKKELLPHVLSDSSVQLSDVQLFVTPWTAACQASLSFTSSRSLLKLMSIESVMPSNHLILCHPLLLLPSIFPSIRVFSGESVRIRGQTIGASASASVLPMNIQDWFSLGLSSLISLQSKGFSRVFSNTTV